MRSKCGSGIATTAANRFSGDLNGPKYILVLSSLYSSFDVSEVLGVGGRVASCVIMAVSSIPLIIED